MRPTRAPHRPEPTRAVGSRGERYLPACSPHAPRMLPACSPHARMLPACSLHPCYPVQLPRSFPVASRGTRGHEASPSKPEATTHSVSFFTGGGCKSCSACVKPAKRFERSSSFVAAASPSALSETWGGRCRGDAGEMQGRCRRDAGEMHGRCGGWGDAGEMLGGCKDIQYWCVWCPVPGVWCRVPGATLWHWGGASVEL